MVELANKDFDKAGIYFHEAIKSCLLLAELLYHARSHRALGEIAVIKEDIVGAKKHFEITIELCKAMGLPKEHLYFDYTCCLPSENLDGWKLYQQDNAGDQWNDQLDGIN